MGNKSLNKKTEKNRNYDIKQSDTNKSDDFIDVKSILKKISQNRKNELIDFLLSKVTKVEELQKEEQKQINNKNLSFPFESKFDYDKNINSYFILLSNDIIIVPTKYLYKDNKSPSSLSFSHNEIKYDIFHLIIENDGYNNNFSIIKILNKEFNFKNYYEIPDDIIDIGIYEKYYINEKNEEESIGITPNKQEISDKNNICPRSPIYIKKDDKLFLVGIINKNDEIYTFSKDELINIKNKIEIIEFNFKLYQIQKLDFNEQNINDEEMHFIFQYNYINLEYLDLQNKNLTNKGIKALQNKSLKNVKYLNISNNNITDEGLKYLNELNNINEFILLNMNKLSEDYFLSLQGNFSFENMKNFKCDKTKLTLKYVRDNYNDFNLPNLTSLKIVDKTREIHLTLKGLFRLDKICTKIKELDLSNSGLNDNGMLRLTKNIKVFKSIELINLEGSFLTTYSKQYFELIEKQKIKIILNQKNLEARMQKLSYKILLGGSTISGKTSFVNTYSQKYFYESMLTTIGVENYDFKFSKCGDKKFILFDTSRAGLEDSME